MKCDQCNNEATVFLTDFINGEVRKVSLCEQCALERSSGEEGAGLEFSDLLWGLGNPDQKVSLEEEHEEQELLCPHCGFAESDFDKTERLGCPQCYGVYAERLSGMWKNFQSGMVHTGKRPPKAEAWAEALATPLPTQIPGADTPSEKVAKVRPPVETGKDGDSAENESPRISTYQHKISELQAQMAEALREEAYEHAATLRDLIRDQEQLIRDFEHSRQRPRPETVGSTAQSATSESA